MITRMIERWFPCQEVSESSRELRAGRGSQQSGRARAGGSGKSEKALFTWFAARPIAQARAAVLTSLLPWPDEVAEQRRLQRLVTAAVLGDAEVLEILAAEIGRAYPGGRPRMLDPFSGRAIIPLEAARAGAEAWGLEYAPVAALAGMLLADYPSRDWSAEPSLPFGEPSPAGLSSSGRLLHDLRILLAEIGRQYEQQMCDFYPADHRGVRPWGYFWSQTMPCDHCRHRFPLVGTAVLSLPSAKAHEPGASFSFHAERNTGICTVLIHEGTDSARPTLLKPKGRREKIARCPFCQHPHAMDVVKARAADALLEDRLLIVAERTIVRDTDGRPLNRLAFRPSTEEDGAAVARAEAALVAEPPFRGRIPAVPAEPIPPGNHDTVRASLYGAKHYGDLCCARQTLGFVRLCRVIEALGPKLQEADLSEDYARALLGYAGSVLVRKLRYSTRGATIKITKNAVEHIFVNQASLNHSFDFLETGIGDGPATWASLAVHTIWAVEKLARIRQGQPARVRMGSALHLPVRPRSVTAVITDPPYYNMIDYTDASDLFFVWLKRALGGVFPELFEMPGLQPKEEEIIVKRGAAVGDHRTRVFYTDRLAEVFAGVRRALRDDGILTLVFGHGDPDAWELLMGALARAGLIVTGSWPARTEAESGAGAANIAVTITISCHPAPTSRPDGLQATVDLAVEREIRGRMASWDRANLAHDDQMMAANGPAMEVFGRYERVLRPDGSLVPISHYLALAARTVKAAADYKVEGLPLDSFDARTHFALYWARTHRRQMVAKSAAAWLALGSSFRLDEVRRGVLAESTAGYHLAEFGEQKTMAELDQITPTSDLIDVVRAMVRGWRVTGSSGVAAVLVRAGRTMEDGPLQAVLSYLPNVLPADPDRKSIEDIRRNGSAIAAAVREQEFPTDEAGAQITLFAAAPVGGVRVSASSADEPVAVLSADHPTLE